MLIQQLPSARQVLPACCRCWLEALHAHLAPCIGYRRPGPCCWRRAPALGARPGGQRHLPCAGPARCAPSLPHTDVQKVQLRAWRLAQAQPWLQVVCLSQPPRPPRPLLCSPGPRQSSRSDPNERELNTWLHSAGSAGKILDLVQRYHLQFNNIHAVTALQTLARLPPRARPSFAGHAAWPLLLDTVQRFIPTFQPRQLSSAVWACNTLNVRSAEMLSTLLAAAQASMVTRPQTWNSMELSTLLDGLAGLQLGGDSAVLVAAEQLLPQVLPAADARPISNCVWAFGKRQHALGPGVVEAVARRFSEVVQLATPQAVANLLYGLAIMGAAPRKQLLDSCEERLVDTLQLATAQSVANAIWALGQLGHCPPDSSMQKLLHADAMQVRPG